MKWVTSKTCLFLTKQAIVQVQPKSKKKKNGNFVREKCD
jgi:hypothetical protein